MEVMKNYYYMHFKDDIDSAPAYVDRYSIDNISQLQPNGIDCIQFNLNEGRLKDYQSNDLGWPLMSSELRRVFAEQHAERNVIWHRAIVKVNGEPFCYFIPQFLDQIDVIDEKKSKIVSGPLGDVVIKACLSLGKVGTRDFFSINGSEIRLVISIKIKSGIEQRELTGIDFSDVPVA